MTTTAQPTRSPFVLLHPDGFPMALPVGITYDDAVLTAIGHAKADGRAVRLVRDTGGKQLPLGEGHANGEFVEA